MPLDASIYGDFKQPATQPFNISSLMQLRGQTAEIQLRLAQTAQQQQLVEQERLKADQMRRDQMDISTIQETMRDPVLGPKIASGDVTPLLGKVQQQHIDALQTAAQNHIKEQAAIDKTTLENRNTALSALAEGIQGLGEDSTQINANLTAFKSNPANQLLFKNAGIDSNTIPTVGDAADLKKWEADVGVAQAVTNKALALKKEQQGIEKTTADIKKLTNENTLASAEIPTKTAIANATLNDPDLLSPEQREKATEALNKPTSTLGAEEQFVQEYQRLHPGATVAQAQRAYALNKDLPSKADPTAALDRESTRFAKPHEKALADANSQLEKIADARAMINGNAESQALGVPKVMTALVSGQGSGIRITQAELNSIAKARGIAGSLEGFVNSVSGEGKLTDTQKQQLSQILDDVASRVKQKQSIANEALDKINGARSRDEIVKIDTETRNKLTNMEGVAPIKLKDGRTLIPHDKAAADKFRKEHPELIQ